MKKDNMKIKITALASSAAMLTAFGANAATTTEMFDFESLGTGTQVRTNLITADALNAFTSNTDVEFECGEGKCGEGKCGEKGDKKDDKAKKSDAKMEAKPAAKSAKEGKMEAAPAPAKEAKPAKPASDGGMNDTPKN